MSFDLPLRCLALLLGGALLATAALCPCPVLAEGLAAREKGFSGSRSTREALDASFAPRRIAVLVGINDYEDAAFPALKWAARDASELGRILADPAYGGFDRVVTLTTGAQTRRDRILAELVSLRNDLRRQDTLIFFQSGHGTMSISKSGEPRLYLVAHDTLPGDLEGTAIELAELQRFFSDIRAEQKALILDACYNGREKSVLLPTVRQRVERMEETPTLSRKVRLGESEAHLFASTFGRPAREDDELRHGVYTYHLLEGLTWKQAEADSNSDHVVTIYEAHDYARAKTISYTTGAQVPEAYFRIVGRSDLILVGRPQDRLKARLGALYFYGAEREELSGATLFVDGQEKGVLPGTYPIPAGRHHVRIIGEDGRVLEDRSIGLVAGEAVSADAMGHRPLLRAGFLGGGALLRLPLNATLWPLVGRALVGIQLHGGYRFNGPLAGLTISAQLAYAPHNARFDGERGSSYRLRHVLSGGLGIGGRLLLPRGYLGAAYRLRLTGLSRIDFPPCSGAPACDAWFYGGHGLALEQALSLGRRWSLRLEEELGLTVLDTLGAGPAPALDLGVTLALEMAL